MTKLPLVLLSIVLAGCTAAIPIPTLDATHPASPHAPEAPPPALRTLTTGSKAANVPAGHGGNHAH